MTFQTSCNSIIMGITTICHIVELFGTTYSSLRKDWSHFSLISTTVLRPLLRMNQPAYLGCFLSAAIARRGELIQGTSSYWQTEGRPWRLPSYMSTPRIPKLGFALEGAGYFVGVISISRTRRFWPEQAFEKGKRSSTLSARFLSLGPDALVQRLALQWEESTQETKPKKKLTTDLT